jgi:hypothetical protein
VQRFAPNMQSFARKERYTVTWKGRPKLSHLGAMWACLTMETAAEGAQKRDQVPVLRPRRVDFEVRNARKHFDHATEL